jgi:hypothetical protein
METTEQTHQRLIELQQEYIAHLESRLDHYKEMLQTSFTTFDTMKLAVDYWRDAYHAIIEAK